MRSFLLRVLWLTLPATLTSAAVPLERWVYAPVNHLVPEEVVRVEALMERARKAGYTHFLLADSKFSRLEQMEPRYFSGVTRIQETAARLGLACVPAVFPAGYSNDILWHDPNLAEGLPVRDALFVVKDGAARPGADPPVGVPPFAERRKWGFIDDNLVARDGGLILTDGAGANARAMLKVKVSPFRHYHAAVTIRTRDFQGAPEIKALDPVSGRSLCYTALGAARDQDWTTHHVTFNSLDHNEIALYFGVWAAGDGTLEMREPILEEAGAVNLLRRPGCPVTVRGEDGRELKEGRDFELWQDPRLGNQPYGGEYEVWHDAPPLRTALPDGTRLRVSYFHPHIIHEGQVCGAVKEPAFMELLKQQAAAVHAAWGAETYHMSHDEWRVLGWDAAGVTGQAPGAVVAGNVRACEGFLNAVNPGGRTSVWSDMFDPWHNAVENYCLVNGDLRGSWEGLAPGVIVMNWNFERRAESLAFFSRRGNRQILSGYYDAGPDQIKVWLAAARGVPGVIGVMYTTWRKNYTDLEAFAAHVSAWEKAE